MGLTPTVAVADLAEATPTRVEVDGVPVCLVRLEDGVHAVHDTCSHQRWSLSEGLVWGTGVECSLHGSTFDLTTGAPMSLPATTPIPTFAVEVRDGTVLVDVSTALNGAVFPEH
jgi:3-phenylpropionate/trans-cinnamate dioxygenase ferredoxin component